MILVENNSVSAIFGDVPEPCNFKKTFHETNKYQRLRDSVGWTYLREWVLQGPWDIDKGGSRFYCVLRSLIFDPLSSEQVLSP